MSPMANFHGARVRDPGAFLDKPWATINLKGIEGIELVTGKLKKDGPKGPMVAQSYRFDKTQFTEKGAKKWMKRHKVKPILFESAKEEVKEEVTSMTAMVGAQIFGNAWENATKKKKKEPDMNPMRRVLMGEQEVVATSDPDGYLFKGSQEWLRGKIRDALKESKKYGEWPDIISTFDDKVYVYVYDSLQSQTRYFEVEYDFDGEETVTLGDGIEILKKTEWIIKEQAEEIKADLFPVLTEKILEPDLSDDEQKKALKVPEKAAKEAGIGEEKK